MRRLNLIVDDVHGPPLPPWAERAVRRGILRTRAVLDVDALPNQVILTNHPSADAVLGATQPDPDRDAAVHTDKTIVISHTATMARRYEAKADVDADAEHVLAYCAAFQYCVFLAQKRALPVMRGVSDLQIYHAMANAASGFILTARAYAENRWPLLQITLAFLSRLRERQGAESIWAGEAGSLIFDLAANGSFFQIPDYLTCRVEDAYRLDPTEIHRLINYATGKGRWPIPRYASRS